MNDRTRKRFLNVVLIVGLIVGGAYWARHNSITFNLFLPPSEIYRPLAMETLANENKHYRFQVTHKYPGNYEVAVAAPTSPGIGVAYKMGFEAQVVIKAGSKVIHNQLVTEPYSQFWRNEDGGIVLLKYRVPDSVPKNIPIQITVGISGNVGEFNKMHGNSTLVVTKGSDK